MIRDPLKPKAYFDDNIEFWMEALESKKARLSHPDSLKPSGRVGGSYGVVEDTLTLLELRYSRGDAIADMKADVEQLLTYRRLQAEHADALPEEDQSDRVMWERLDQDSYELFLQWLAFALGAGMSSAYIQEGVDVRRTARMLERNRDLIQTKAAVIDSSGVQQFNKITVPE